MKRDREEVYKIHSYIYLYILLKSKEALLDQK